MALSKLKIGKFSTSRTSNEKIMCQKSPPIMEQQEFQISTMGFLQMQDKIETQKGENKILRQKLQSKAEALLIITKELEKVRGECDEYRELVQRLQQSQSSVTSKPFAPEDTLNTLEALSSLPVGLNMKVVAVSDSSDSFNSRAFRDQTVASRFSALRNENKRLLLERENVKRILNEREEDIRLLRMQTRKEKSAKNGYSNNKEAYDNIVNVNPVFKPCRNESKCSHISATNGCTCGRPSDNEVVRQLEVHQMKYDKLKHDFQVCIYINNLQH